MEKDIRDLPIKIILGFLIFSELFLWIGPVNYRISNPVILILYLVLMNVSLYYGYKTGLRNYRPSTFHLSNTWLKVLLIGGLIASFRYLVMIWGNHGVGFSFANLIQGILDPGKVYLAEAEQGGYSGTFLDMIVLDPIRWCAIPLGLIFWKKLSKTYRTVTIVTIFFTVATHLGVGMRKSVFDVIIIVFFIILARNPQIIQNSRSRRRVVLYAVLAVALFLVFFVFSIASRRGDELATMVTFYNGTVRHLYEHLPGWLTYSLCSIESYLCQGYYALSKALNMGIRPIAFFGDSWVSVYYSQKFFGYNPMPDTYMAPLDQFYGIDPRVNWHTMYLWLANQYTFIGVPFVIFWVGYCLAKTWCEALNGQNDIVYPVLAYFLIMSFYMFANNQVFSDSATSFWIWFILYYSLKKKIITK